jgi:hypothetical protein
VAIRGVPLRYVEEGVDIGRKDEVRISKSGWDFGRLDIERIRDVKSLDESKI